MRNCEIFVRCSDEDGNCIQGHETACKLMKLHACSWNWMQAQGSSCKPWNLFFGRLPKGLLKSSWSIREVFLESSMKLHVFWNSPENSRAGWNSLEQSGTFQIAYCERISDLDSDTQMDRQTEFFRDRQSVSEIPLISLIADSANQYIWLIDRIHTDRQQNLRHYCFEIYCIHLYVWFLTLWPYQYTFFAKLTIKKLAFIRTPEMKLKSDK